MATKKELQKALSDMSAEYVHALKVLDDLNQEHDFALKSLYHTARALERERKFIQRELSAASQGTPHDDVATRLERALDRLLGGIDPNPNAIAALSDRIKRHANSPFAPRSPFRKHVEGMLRGILAKVERGENPTAYLQVLLRDIENA